MYSHPKFDETNRDLLIPFMESNPFMTLVGYDGDFPVATQVPVKVELRGEELFLIGHMMKKTDHYEAFLKNDKALALFTGAHAYISASVYEQPAVASTWNYSSVQAKGKLRLLDDDETLTVICELTDHYEDPASSKAAFKYMTDDYIQKNLKAISGFEIQVQRIRGLFKLSQNHPEVNRERIIAHLSKSNNEQDIRLAEDMKKATN